MTDVALQSEIEVLKTSNNEEELIKACNFISNFFKNDNSNEKHQSFYTSIVVKYLVQTASHKSGRVRVVAEEKLQKFLKVFIHLYSDQILTSLIGLIQGETTDSALTNFSFVCEFVTSLKVHIYVETLVSQCLLLFKERKQTTIHILMVRLPKILENLGNYFTAEHFEKLLLNLLSLIRDDVRQIRRNTSKIVYYIYKYHHSGNIELFCTNLMKTCTSYESVDGCLIVFSNLTPLIVEKSKKKGNEDLIQIFSNLSFRIIEKYIFEDEKYLSCCLMALNSIFTLPIDVKAHSSLIEQIFEIAQNNKIVMNKSDALDIITRVYDTHGILSSISHHVPQMMELFKNEDYTIRGKNAILCGTIISAYIKEIIKVSHEEEEKILVKMNPKIDSISLQLTYKKVPKKSLPTIPLDNMINEMFNCLENEPNSLGIKMIIQAFGIFLPLCIHLPSQRWKISYYILKFIDFKNSFWSVKVQILQLLAGFDYTVIEYYQKQQSNLNQIILKKIMSDLQDDDYRVREEAAETLIEILPVLVLKKEAEIITFQRMISEKKNDLTTDREVKNLSTIINLILNQLKISEKSKVDGFLKFLILAGEKYSMIIKDYSEEIVDEMIDFLRFKENSYDLSSQIQTINNIRLFFCESRTDHVLKYILFIMNLLNEFRLNSNHDMDKTNWNEVFMRRNYEKHYGILKTSFQNFTSKFSEDDKIEQLRTSLLLTLKKVIEVGDIDLIISKYSNIIEQVLNHLKYDRISGIQCLHELFNKIFGSEEKKQEQKKKICDFENINVFEYLSLTKKFVSTVSRSNSISFFLSEKLEEPALLKILQEMEEIFVEEIKSFDLSISKDLNSAMMKLMIDLVNIGHSNRDKSFLQHLLLLIKEQEYEVLLETSNRDHVELLANLKYQIQFIPPQLTNNSVILKITEGISENPQSLNNYTPILIQSFKKNDQVQQEIFPIYLKYMNSVGIRPFVELLYTLKLINDFKQYTLLSNTLMDHFLEYQWEEEEDVIDFIDLLSPSKDKVMKLWKSTNWNQNLSNLHLFLIMKLLNNSYCISEDKFSILLNQMISNISNISLELLSHMIEELITSISLITEFQAEEGVKLFSKLLNISKRFHYNITLYLQIIELCVVYGCKNNEFAEIVIDYFCEIFEKEEECHQDFIINFFSYFCFIYLLMKNYELKSNHTNKSFWRRLIANVDMRETKDFLKLCQNRIVYDGLVSFLDTELNDKNARAVSNVLKNGKPSPILFDAIERNLDRLKIRKRVLQESALLMIKKDSKNQSSYKIHLMDEKINSKDLENLNEKSLNEASSDVILNHIKESNGYKYLDYFLSSCNPVILEKIIDHVDLRFVANAIPKIKNDKIMKFYLEYVVEKMVSYLKEIKSTNGYLIALCLVELHKVNMKLTVEKLYEFFEKLMSEFQNGLNLSASQVETVLSFNIMVLEMIKNDDPDWKSVNHSICCFYLDLINEPHIKEPVITTLRLISPKAQLGNKIPFLHLFKDKFTHLGIEIAKQNRIELYNFFLDSNNINVDEMNRLVFFLSSVPLDVATFKALWILYYKLFQSISNEECNQSQLVSLKILTKLISMMRVTRTGKSKIKPDGFLRDSMKHYLLIHHNLISTDSYVLVDKTFSQALFNGFIKFSERLIHLQKHYNKELCKELFRSILIILINHSEKVEITPKEFKGKEIVLISPISLFTTKFQLFGWLQASVISILDSNPDRFMRKYLIRILTKCANYARSFEKHKIIVDILVTNFKSKYMHETACLATLDVLQIEGIINDLIPIITPLINGILNEQITITSHYRFIKLMTSIIDHYRVASVYHLTSKILFNFLRSIADINTPLKLVDAIYQSLIHLINNYSLSTTERKIIYSIADLSLIQNSGSELTLKNSLMKVFVDILNTQIKNSDFGERVDIFPVNIARPERNLLQKFMGYEIVNPKDYANYIPILTQYGPELENQIAKKSRFAMFMNLVIASLYSQDTNQSEHEKLQMNVLNTYHSFKGISHRSVEFFVQILPPLLEDFLVKDQILPLVLMSYLKGNTHEELMKLFLRIHLPKKFSDGDFGNWIQYCIDTFELKSPNTNAIIMMTELFLICLRTDGNDLFDFIDVEREEFFVILGFQFVKFMEKRKLFLELKSFKETLKRLKHPMCDQLLKFIQ
eukprot:gene8330-154_t